MFSYSSGLMICSKTSRMSHSFANSSISDRTHFHGLGLVSQHMERHSSWSAGSQRATIPLLAYKACNACFGPWNTHANFDSKKAWFRAWLSSPGASSPWFLENLQELAHVRGILVPVGEASVKDFLESL